MHSATEAYLKKQNLIDTVQPSNDVAFGTYQGKRVIVDDGCPVSDGTYTTYLFGKEPWLLVMVIRLDLYRLRLTVQSAKALVLII